MLRDLSFTQTEFLLVILSIFLGIVLLIGLSRLYYSAKINFLIKSKKGKTERLSRNKYKEVDVFKNSQRYRILGLIAVLIFVIGAFNWTSTEKIERNPSYVLAEEADIEIAPPRSRVEPPPPPPPSLVQEVPDDVILEEEDIEFVDQSVDAETVVEAPPPVQTKKDVKLPPPPPPPPPREEEPEEIFKIVEDMPRFPGCENLMNKEERQSCSTKKLYEFIYDNIKYPTIARENGIQGTVVIQFVVNTKGEISGAHIVRDIGGGCGNETLRVVNMMNDLPKKWLPGKQRGRAVNVMFTLPVRYVLEVS